MTCANHPRSRLTVIGVMLLLLPALPATAQGSRNGDSLSCRRQCDATSSVRALNPRPIQACLIRCGAGQRYLTQQHQGRTPEATGRGGAPRNAVASLPAAPLQPSLVAYACILPGRGLAIASAGSRQAAHSGAVQNCSLGNQHGPCTLLAETQSRCLSVARGVTAAGLVMTRDPNTYTLHHYGSGSGASTASASQAALRDCESHAIPGLRCQIAASRCT